MDPADLERARLVDRGDDQSAQPAHQSRLARLDPVIGDLRQPALETWGSRAPLLMMSSNGFGMGHLMRLMSVAMRLPEDAPVTVFSLSAAADVLARSGFTWEYMTSYRPGFRDHTWEHQLANRLDELLDRTGAGGLVFDGVMPYSGLVDAVQTRRELVTVWLRRGMWKQGRGQEALERAAAFTHVIEPGELDGDVTVTDGRATGVGPVTLVDRTQMLHRGDARRILGIAPDEKVILLLWAVSALSHADSMTRVVVEHLARTDWTVMVPGSPLDRMVVPPNVRTFRSLPMAHLFRAFDAAISSSGYNSSYELLVGGVPTVFVPNPGTGMDDQVARARMFSRAGVSIDGGQDPATVVAAVDRVRQPDERHRTACQARRAVLGQRCWRSCTAPGGVDGVNIPGVAKWVAPGSPLRRVARAPRRAEATARRLLLSWTVVIATGLEPDAESTHRARAIHAAATARIVWVTDTPTLGRTWPSAWVVHRVAPTAASVDMPALVGRWLSGSMRIRRVVVLTDLAGSPERTGSPPGD